LTRSIRQDRSQSWATAALSRDREPQENEPEEDKQGLEDQVHSRVRDVMKTKDPVYPHDIDAQDKAHPCQDTPEE